MIAPERTMGKPFFVVFWASKTAAGRLSEAPIKRTAQSECGIFERLNHAFVRRIIMQPYFGQAHAKLARQTMDRCLRARFGSRSGFLSPPAPRGVDGPGQEFLSDSFLSESFLSESQASKNFGLAGNSSRSASFELRSACRVHSPKSARRVLKAGTLPAFLLAMGESRSGYCNGV
jgi:hypothetical protein